MFYVFLTIHIIKWIYNVTDSQGDSPNIHSKPKCPTPVTSLKSSGG